MAKSLVGGSRAYLKGRIGSDVYSLGKDGKGRRQQIVRALPEAVTNPRTTQQMVGRMVMSTISQAVAQMAPIIDHSFDGVPVGQPSISEFTRRNYALLKAGDGVYNMYQEKGIKQNAYIVSSGKAKFVNGVGYAQSENDDDSSYGKWGIVIPLPAGSLTVGDLKKILGFGAGDGYMTLLYIGKVAGRGEIKFQYHRYRLNPANADSVTISDEMAEPLFVYESNVDLAEITITAATASAAGQVYLGGYGGATNKNQGVILSRYVGGKWIHSSCQLSAPDSDDRNFDAALATYPVGTEQFLNGGDL